MIILLLWRPLALASSVPTPDRAGTERSRPWQDLLAVEVLLARAVAGDEQAFAALVDPYARELRLHCYRILGSLTDAEDLLQETLLAAWRGLATFERRSSLRTWLYRIATNRCLNTLRDNGRKIPPPAVAPFTPPEPTTRSEITWLQPFPDDLLHGVPDSAPGPEFRYQQQEAVQLAFIAALQALPRRQTATLVLRDVLGYTADEVADMLDTTPTAVKGMLQRARATLDQTRPTPARPAKSAEDLELGTRFAEAFTEGDIDALLTLLTDDAWLAMPPAPHEYRGRDAIAAFLHVSGAWRGQRRLLLTPTRANTQPAYGCYLTEPGASVGTAAGLMVLTITGERISGMTRFLDNIILPQFGLPKTIST